VHSHVMTAAQVSRVLPKARNRSTCALASVCTTRGDASRERGGAAMAANEPNDHACTNTRTTQKLQLQKSKSCKQSLVPITRPTATRETKTFFIFKPSFSSTTSLAPSPVHNTHTVTGATSVR
jgi:hypothetical protein